MISRKDIEYLSRLSRIDIKDSEEERLAEDLRAILEYVKMLQDVGTEDETFTHLSYLTSCLRRDDRDTIDEEEAIRAKNLLEASPQQEKGFVKVKSVLEK